MTDLLEAAVDAHGGLDRWRRVRAVDLRLSITGAIWSVVGRPDVLRDITMHVSTDAESVVTTFPGTDKRTTFTPQRVTVETVDGSLVEARDDPERSFPSQDPWDDVQVAYFSGEALWTYLTTPFLFVGPDFTTAEIEPVEVGRETWRRLHVTFPDGVASHTREQIFCFGPDGLLRRHDYTVDILGGATGANLASGYRDVDGIVVPTTRRVHSWIGEHELVPDPVLVAIDIAAVTLRT